MEFEQAVEKVKINPDLELAVLSDMPADFNKMEKTIYIYTKLCSMLNYDSQFWASNQDSGPRGEYHQKLENIEKITPNNPDVVCYNFSVIFAKFLEDLGVDYQFIGFSNNIKYGEHADIVISFLQEDVDCEMKNFYTNVYFAGFSDMKNFRVKNNIEPYLVNRNTFGEAVDEEFDKYFKDKCKKIVNVVKSQIEIEKQKQVRYEKDEIIIQNLERAYLRQSGKVDKIDKKEKLDILLHKLNNVDMDNYSACFYRRKIFKNITKNIQSDKLYTYSILREKIDEEINLYDMISILNVCGDNDDFYVKYSRNETKILERCEIQAGFDVGMYDYIYEANMLPLNGILPRIRSASIDEIFKTEVDKYNVEKQSISKYLDSTKNNKDMLPPSQIALYSMYFKPTESEAKNKIGGENARDIVKQV